MSFFSWFSYNTESLEYFIPCTDRLNLDETVTVLSLRTLLDVFKNFFCFADLKDENEVCLNQGKSKKTVRVLCSQCNVHICTKISPHHLLSEVNC